ncbi:MAG TPA: hypothetical protein VGE45_00430 [Chloroflexia bacterium]|jgi:hypothetical protein
MSKPTCIRCFEDFPVVQEAKGSRKAWRMGEMREILIGTAANRTELENYVPVLELQQKLYLCGNCFFDLTDEADEED